jgi:hypothetical protein
MKTPQEATIEEMLEDLTCYEDPDSYLVIATTFDGGVQIGNVDSWAFVTARTLREALAEYSKDFFDDRDYDGEIGSPRIDWRA